MFSAAYLGIEPCSPCPLQSADILKGTSLPLVAVICPMALQDPGDDPVQVSLHTRRVLELVAGMRSSGDNCRCRMTVLAACCSSQPCVMLPSFAMQPQWARQRSLAKPLPVGPWFACRWLIGANADLCAARHARRMSTLTCASLMAAAPCNATFAGQSECPGCRPYCLQSQPPRTCRHVCSGWTASCCLAHIIH